MKLITLTIAAALAFAGVHAKANEPDAALRDAKAIIAANNYEASMDMMLGNLMPAVGAGFIGELSTSQKGNELLARIDAKYPGGRKAFAKRFADIFYNDFKSQYPQISEQAARLYTLEFTPAELAEIRAFVESPVGRRMMAATPKIQQLMSDAGRKLGENAGSAAAEKLLNEAEQHIGAIK